MLLKNITIPEKYKEEWEDYVDFEYPKLKRDYLEERIKEYTMKFKRPVQSNEYLLKFTNPYVLQNIFAKKSVIKLKPLECHLPGRSKKRRNLIWDRSPETQEVLDCIQEPRVWEEGGETWTQVVSPQIAKRCDITKLSDAMNSRLIERNVRHLGPNPHRFDLYVQLFDEVIRQVTITCAERGLFLLRIRNQLYLTIYEFRNLFERANIYSEKLLTRIFDKMVVRRQELEAARNEVETLKKQILEAKLNYKVQEFFMADKWDIECDNQCYTKQAFMRRNRQLKIFVSMMSSGTCHSEPGVDDRSALRPSPSEELINLKKETTNQECRRKKRSLGSSGLIQMFAPVDKSHRMAYEAWVKEENEETSMVDVDTTLFYLPSDDMDKDDYDGDEITAVTSEMSESAATGSIDSPYKEDFSTEPLLELDWTIHEDRNELYMSSDSESDNRDYVRMPEIPEVEKCPASDPFHEFPSSPRSLCRK